MSAYLFLMLLRALRHSRRLRHRESAFKATAPSGKCSSLPCVDCNDLCSRRTEFSPRGSGGSFQSRLSRPSRPSVRGRRHHHSSQRKTCNWTMKGSNMLLYTHVIKSSGTADVISSLRTLRPHANNSGADPTYHKERHAPDTERRKHATGHAYA